MTNNPTPVFIGGCDRSGTTMLGSFLGSHTDILCVPEAQFIFETYKEAKRKDFLDKPDAILNAIESHLRFQLWGIDIKELYSKVYAQSNYSDIISLIVGKYAVSVNKSGFSFWADHVPSNIKNTRGLIDLFPNAKFIHIIRDGRAVAASLKSVRWGPKTMDKMAVWWMNYIAHGLAAEAALSQDQIIRVNYEEIVLNPKPTLDRICEFLKISFEPSMISGEGLNLPQHYKEIEQLVGSPPDVSRVSSWQENMRARDIEIFEYFTGDLLLNLGYQTIYYPSEKKETKIDRLKSIIAVFSQIFGSYLSYVKIIYNARFQNKRK